MAIRTFPKKATARVEFRMDEALKKEIEAVAELQNQTFTAFATQTLVERAREILKKRQATILDDSERDAFLAMLETPPVPTDALKKLMATKVTL